MLTRFEVYTQAGDLFIRPAKSTGDEAPPKWAIKLDNLTTFAKNGRSRPALVSVPDRPNVLFVKFRGLGRSFIVQANNQLAERVTLELNGAEAARVFCSVDAGGKVTSLGNSDRPANVPPPSPAPPPAPAPTSPKAATPGKSANGQPPPNGAGSAPSTIRAAARIEPPAPTGPLMPIEISKNDRNIPLAICCGRHHGLGDTLHAMKPGHAMISVLVNGTGRESIEIVCVAEGEYLIRNQQKRSPLTLSGQSVPVVRVKLRQNRRTETMSADTVVAFGEALLSSPAEA